MKYEMFRENSEAQFDLKAELGFAVAEERCAYFS